MIKSLPPSFVFLAAFALLLLIGYVVYRYFNRNKLKIAASVGEYDFADSLFVTVEDFDIHYVQAGKGPHLLLLHGIGASIYCWRYIFSLLAQNFTVTALDLPGFGMSSKLHNKSYGLDEQAHRVQVFLDELGIQQTRILGCSMGGSLGLWLARQDPQRFFEVAAIAPALRPNLISLNLKALSWWAPMMKFGVNATLVRKIMERVVARHEKITDDVIQRNLQPYINDSAAIKTFIHATDLVKDPRLSKELKNIQSRTLVLWGEKDRIIPVKDINIARKKIKQVQIYTHPSAGHHLMEDEPEWVQNALIQFFGSQDI